MNEKLRPAGYAFLIERLALSVMPNWHASAIAARNSRRTDQARGLVSAVYPSALWPGDSVGDHLEFALKYDGTNLQILAAVFAAAAEKDLTDYIRATPLGKYVRRIWYLYEWCTGRQLPVEPIARIGYVPLIEPDEQYTTAGRPISRQRVFDNLLGNPRFCPTVRRTDTLRAGEAARLDERGRQVIADCRPDVLRRAMHYLYTKETRSSFEIERERPTTDRTERFVALLHGAERESYVDHDRLVKLQNQITDVRFHAVDYNRRQNYVSQTVGFGGERVHYVTPRPPEVPILMDGWVACHHSMGVANVYPVVHAAVLAYAFVFIHPFEDGNGRIHRFLIHNVLSTRAFTPPDAIFPVSAVMLRDAAAYDRSLEAFSKPLMGMVEYELDETTGHMTVRNDTATLYRYMDLTVQAEAMFDFVRTTIDHELVDEIRFIRQYDRAKRSIQGIVDAPDKLINLFIRCCIDQHNRVSKRHRETTFKMLTDDEIERMEWAVTAAREDTAEPPPQD